MDQEISKGTWVGATVLAIVAILGLSFAVYGISRNLVNNSSADFINTVDTVQKSGFNDFDGTVVSGLQVRQAIENYEGDKIAIFVNTSGIQLATYGEAKVASTWAWNGKLGSKVASASAPFAAFNRKESIDADKNVMMIYVGRAYVDYNALFLNPTGGKKGDTGVNLYDSGTGFIVYEGEFKLVDGTSDLLFNSVKSNLKNVSCSEYIPSGANFNAKLIKDGTGTIIGMMFSQVY